jgi:hypothetical protein
MRNGFIYEEIGGVFSRLRKASATSLPQSANGVCRVKNRLTGVFWGF